MATSVGAQRFLHALRQSVGGRLRGGDRRNSRAPEAAPGLRVGHGRGHRRGARAVLHRRPHRRPSAQLYAATQLLFQAVCPRMGHRGSRFVDGHRAGRVRRPPVRPGKTTLVFAETPANPKLDVIDLDEGWGAIGRPRHRGRCPPFGTPGAPNSPCATASTWCSTRPTKGIAGPQRRHHRRGGPGSRELIDWLWGFAVLQGATASPHDAASAVRGIRHGCPSASARQCESAPGHRHPPSRPVPTWSTCGNPGLGVAPATPTGDAADERGRHVGHLRRGPVGWRGGRRFVEGVGHRPARPRRSAAPRPWSPIRASTTHVNLLPEELAANGHRSGKRSGCRWASSTPDDLIADLAPGPRRRSRLIRPCRNSSRSSSSGASPTGAIGRTIEAVEAPDTWFPEGRHPSGRTSRPPWPAPPWSGPIGSGSCCSVDVGDDRPTLGFAVRP